MSHLRHLTLPSCLAVWLPSLPVQASEFTSAQRAEIVQIIGDALKHDPAIQSRINAHLQLARSIGIEGTLALVIGGELIPGAVDVPELRKAVTTARGAKSP